MREKRAFCGEMQIPRFARDDNQKREFAMTIKKEKMTRR